MEKQFVSTDVYIGFELKDINVEDITDISVSVISIEENITLNYSMLDNDIIIRGTKAILHIEDTDITVPGLYRFRMTIITTDGDKLGMNLNPENIPFR